jgi:hypothetical protein
MHRQVDRYQRHASRASSWQPPVTDRCQQDLAGVDDPATP